MQLMFSLDFDELVDEPIDYWTCLPDVPSEIKDYINEQSDQRVIYDKSTNKYHCVKCLTELKDRYCEKCDKSYVFPNSLNSKYILNTNIDEIKKFTNTSSFYVFHTINEQVLLYEFSVYIYYDGLYMINPYQLRKVKIKHAYQVLKDGIKDLVSEKMYLYKDLDKSLSSSGEFDMEMYEKFLIDNYCDSFLYIDSLEKLKYSELYKNTFIWKLQKTFYKEFFSLASLTMYPLYYHQFESLVKMKLYSLAIKDPYKIKDTTNFNEAFGVDIKYYDFMKAINISSAYLDAMRIIPTRDLELLEFISKDPWLISKLSSYVSIEKLKTYFVKQKLNSEYLYEYYDYIKIVDELKLDMGDRNIMFPKNLLYEHDRLYLETIILKDTKINKKIRDLEWMSDFTIYEDEKFVIPNNSIVLSKMASPTFRSAVVNTSNEQSIVATGNLFIIEVDEKIANPYYIQAFFDSELGESTLNHGSGGVTVKTLSADAIKNIKLPLPPLDKQNEIAVKYQAALDECVILQRKLKRVLIKKRALIDGEE